MHGSSVATVQAQTTSAVALPTAEVHVTSKVATRRFWRKVMLNYVVLGAVGSLLLAGLLSAIISMNKPDSVTVASGPTEWTNRSPKVEFKVSPEEKPIFVGDRLFFQLSATDLDDDAVQLEYSVKVAGDSRPFAKTNGTFSYSPMSAGELTISAGASDATLTSPVVAKSYVVQSVEPTRAIVSPSASPIMLERRTASPVTAAPRSSVPKTASSTTTSS